MKESNIIENLKENKLEELKNLYLDYIERIEVLDVESSEWFIFANEDYYDNGRK